MRRKIRTMMGVVLAIGIFACFGSEAMAKTYTLSEILDNAHQDEILNTRNYYFEGGEELVFIETVPLLGAGPFFAPGDRIVSDIPGVYLFASNPEMDNIKKMRSIIAEGYGIYNRRDGAVGETIGEGAPVLINVHQYDASQIIFETATPGNPNGLFSSVHIVTDQDEEAAYLLSNAYYDERRGRKVKSYRGFRILPCYADDGTIIAYEINLRGYYEGDPEAKEPNAEQYYAKKAALKNVEKEKDTFDAVYYAMNNPDVVAVLGTDAEALWQHYVMFGCMEGRKAYP